MSLAPRIARHPWRVVAGVLALTLLALWPASRLRLETELVALLPDGSPAAEGYRLFLDRFGGLEKVFVLVLPAEETGDDVAGDLLEAAERLAAVLAESPEVASVRSGLSDDDEAFLRRWVVPRAPLLLPEDVWREAVAERAEPAAVARRAARLRAAVTGFGGGMSTLFATEDPLGFAAELPALAGGGALPVDPVTGTFLAAEGDASLVVLTPARGEIDPEGGRALLAELEKAFATVRGEMATPLAFRALGGPLYAAHDEALLREDLERTIAGSAIGCTLLLLVAFEGVLIPLATLLALGAALIWTAAFVGGVLGPITAVGIGFAAVLVGLGIDYGIHGGARFRAARLAGKDPAAALADTFHHTGAGILTSALTTAAGFVVLALAHFRPLRELGAIVAVGMLAVLVASATLGAALVTRSRPGHGRGGPLWRLLGRLTDRGVGLATRHPRPILALAAVLTVAALWHVPSLTVDADPQMLRPADHPMFETERLLVDRFGLGIDTATVMVPGRDLGAALAAAREVSTLLRAELGPGVDLSTPTDWLPGAEVAVARLGELATSGLDRAAEQLAAELHGQGLAPVAFSPGLEALAALGHGEDPGAPPPAAWPDWLREMVRQGDDGPSDDNTVLALRLRLPEGVWPEGPPPELAARISEVAPGTTFASALAIGGEIQRLASADLRRLDAVGLLLIAGVVLLSFRGGLRTSALAALPVVLGSLWTLGLWAAIGRPLDLLTLAVLPILLGIGIDDGLHAIHGARLDPEAGIAGSLRLAGRAIALTTLTTCVGFGSLTLSRVPGLQHGGLLVALGVAACLLATLFVLPALEAAGVRAVAAPADAATDRPPSRS